MHLFLGFDRRRSYAGGARSTRTPTGCPPSKMDPAGCKYVGHEPPAPLLGACPVRHLWGRRRSRFRPPTLAAAAEVRKEVAGPRRRRCNGADPQERAECIAVGNNRAGLECSAPSQSRCFCRRSAGLDLRVWLEASLAQQTTTWGNVIAMAVSNTTRLADFQRSSLLPTCTLVPYVSGTCSMELLMARAWAQPMAQKRQLPATAGVILVLAAHPQLAMGNSGEACGYFEDV